MAIAPTYPGVYIEEIPSGVRSIVGVSTSITAFIGRAVSGVVNEPTIIFNYGDYERQFGGLHRDYPLSYVVRDFFLNGGGQAVIVRLYNPTPSAEALTSLFDDAAADTANFTRAQEILAELGAQDPNDPPVENAVRDEAESAVESFGARLNFLSSTLNTIVEAWIAGAEEALAALPADDPGIPAAEAALDAAEEQLDALDDIDLSDPANYEASLQALTAVRDAVPPEFLIAEVPFMGYAQVQLTPGVILMAAGPGEWGNAYSATVSHNATDEAAESLGLTVDDLFDLEITTLIEGQTRSVERFVNVTMLEHARRLDYVLERTSSLVRATAPPLDENRPAEGDYVLLGGDDGGFLNAESYLESRDDKTGIYALQKADLFNLLCIPPDTRDGDQTAEVFVAAASYCRERRAVLIVDPPKAWGDNAAKAAQNAVTGLPDLGLTGVEGRNAALYFPRVRMADPKKDNRVEIFPACGIIAGVIARTDATRGVWKAPAGLEASLAGIRGLQVNLSDGENGLLNPIGINCLRNFQINGTVIWGARTMRGADQMADDFKYLPVRRTTLFIEESLYRGTQWVVFEPNDEPLWAQIRLNVGAFMNDLFRKGAFQGKTPREAYFVKCDKETTTQNDINLGIVNVVVGFAPLKPAEFVIIKIQQIQGDIQS